ncbi:MAG: OmpA family protein [Rudaea sp.]
MHVAKAHAFEQDKAQVKSKLARSERAALNPSEVGYFLDVLQGRLKQAGVGRVVGGGFDRVVLDLSGTVDFEEARSGMERRSCRRLSAVAAILREYRKALISVRVSAIGNNRHAWLLAQLRARKLANCLVRAGVSAKRIVIVAFKSTDSGSASAGPVHVEIQIEPIVHRRG